jgi:hypothetical protein
VGGNRAVDNAVDGIPVAANLVADSPEAANLVVARREVLSQEGGGQRLAGGCPEVVLRVGVIQVGVIQVGVIQVGGHRRDDSRVARVWRWAC